MDLQTWTASLAAPKPPASISPALEALWWAAKGDWARAHRLAQDDPSQQGSWVHAYLHRLEGDSNNAAYWYRRAGRRVQTGSLKLEWKQIACELLQT